MAQADYAKTFNQILDLSTREYALKFYIKKKQKKKTMNLP